MSGWAEGRNDTSGPKTHHWPLISGAKSATPSGAYSSLANFDFGQVLVRPSSSLFYSGQVRLGPIFWEARRVGAQTVPRPRRVGTKPRKSAKGGGRRVGARKGGGPEISRLFPISTSPISPFFTLSGVFSWNCGPCSRPWTSQSVRYGLSGVILRNPSGERNFGRSGGGRGPGKGVELGLSRNWPE